MTWCVGLLLFRLNDDSSDCCGCPGQAPARGAHWYGHVVAVIWPQTLQQLAAGLRTVHQQPGGWARERQAAAAAVLEGVTAELGLAV
jgi:hypothetical protein